MGLFNRSTLDDTATDEALPAGYDEETSRWFIPEGLRDAYLAEAPTPLGADTFERARQLASTEALAEARRVEPAPRGHGVEVAVAYRERRDSRTRSLATEYETTRLDEFVALARHGDRLTRAARTAAAAERTRIGDMQVRAADTCPICTRCVGGIETVRRDVAPESPWIRACGDCRSILATERARLARLDVPAAAVEQLEQLAASWRSTETSDRPRS